jgi:hypothetical protein
VKALWTLCALCLLAPPALAAPDGQQPYADETLGYKLALPAGWAVAPGMIMAATSPLTGPTDKFQESIKVVAADLQAGVTLAAYVQNSLDAWKAIWKVRSREAVRVGGQPGVRLVIDQTLNQNKTRLVKTFVAHGGKVYVVTCASEPARFKQYQPHFDQAVASLAFSPVQAPTGPQALKVPGGSLAVPATWKRAMPTMFIRDVGDRRGTVMVSTESGTTALTVAAVRAIIQEADLGRIVSDGPATLGGLPAHRLVVVDGAGDQGDTRWRYFAERAGKVVEVIFRVDTAGSPPEALLAEFEAIAATWKWD